MSPATTTHCALRTTNLVQRPSAHSRTERGSGWTEEILTSTDWPSSSPGIVAWSPATCPIRDWARRLEREMMLEALRQSGGVQARAAERLGISERSFWHRMKKLEIRIDRHLRDDRTEAEG